MQAEHLVANVEEQAAQETVSDTAAANTQEEETPEEETVADASGSRSARLLRDLQKLSQDVRDYDLNQTNHYKVNVILISNYNRDIQ